VNWDDPNRMQEVRQRDYAHLVRPLASRLLPLASSCALVLAMAASASAQEPSREREALRRMQQQVSKLQQQNAALEREKAELDQKMKTTETDLAKLKGDLGKAKKTNAALSIVEKDNGDLRAKLADTEGHLKDTVQKCQEQITALEKSIVEGKATLSQTHEENVRVVGTLQVELKAETDRAAACEAKNAALYGVTLDLIKRYKENRGTWEKFLLAEPFTGLKSVEVENLLEDFHEKAAAQKIVPKKD
jgi:septal ring factor EnvC (AmiA/AmiB activator)